MVSVQTFWTNGWYQWGGGVVPPPLIKVIISLTFRIGFTPNLWTIKFHLSPCVYKRPEGNRFVRNKIMNQNISVFEHATRKRRKGII